MIPSQRHTWLSLAFALLFSLAALQSASGDDQLVTLPDGKQAVLHDDFTWEYYEVPENTVGTSGLSENQIPAFLRKGIQAEKATITAAIEMYSQGWRYTMPQPKSRQAAWGNGDGRTTWWYGYWMNTKTKAVSKTDPVRRDNGLYYGDAQDLRNTWRNGGTPPTPTKLEWLLSDSGGVPPE